MRFLQQFNQPLLYILLAAGVVTAFLQSGSSLGDFRRYADQRDHWLLQESKAERDRCLGRVCHHGSNSHP